jgi:protein gp37
LGDKSSIEWTDASWNPTTGCTKVSPGCKNCYAQRLAFRLQKMGNPKYRNGFKFTVQRDALDLPLHWKEPRKIFVNSMSDLFHERMPFNYLVGCFEVMKKANWHIYQILTKRPERMQEFVEAYGEIPEHIWLGTSCEMSLYKKRIAILQNIDVKTRFISFEPLIGPIGKVDLSGISWAIAGGESGPSHRPISPDWVREIRDQCKKQGVAFFFKQWGGHTPKAGGRELDGRTWDEYPTVVPNFSGRPIEVIVTNRKSSR